MTNASLPNYNFRPAQGVSGGDLYQMSAPYVVAPSEPGENTLRYFSTKDPMVVGFELTFRDFTDGLGMQQASIAPGYVPRRLAWCTLDQRHPRTLCLLPLEQEVDLSSLLMGSPQALSAAFVPNESARIYAGGGNTPDQALFLLGAGDESMDVSPVAFNPGGQLISLSVGRIGGIANTVLIVGVLGQVAKVLGVVESVFDDQVAASADDAVEDEDGTTSITAAPMVSREIGDWIGTRYTNVTIPQGATILSAYQSYSFDGSGPTDSRPSGVIYGEDVDNATAFAAAANNISTRTKTSATVDWTVGNDSLPSGFNNSPDIKDILQEIVDRPGWVSGNALNLLYEQTSVGTVIFPRGILVRSFNNGASVAPKLHVEYVAAAGGVTVTDMHALTTNLWGSVLSPINDGTPGAFMNLLYAGTTLKALSSDVAATAEPQPVLTDWPNGGYPIGLMQIPGSPIRIYFFHPFSDLGASVLSLAAGSEWKGKIVHVDGRGQEQQDLDMGLPFLIQAGSWREGIWGHDGLNVIWHNGQKINLGAGQERGHPWETADHFDHTIGIINMVSDADRLFANYCHTGAAGIVTSTWWEEFSLERNAWFSVTKPRPPAAEDATPANLRSIRIGPFITRRDGNRADSTQRMYWYSVNPPGWRAVTLLPTSVNPFYAQNTSSEMFYLFEQEGEATTPRFDLVGYEGYPKVVSEIIYGGELRGTGASFTVEVASQARSHMTFGGAVSATFHEEDRWQQHRARFGDNEDEVEHLQFRFRMERKADADPAETNLRMTSNGLPVTIRGYIFMDGKVKPPSAIEPSVFSA